MLRQVTSTQHSLIKHLIKLRQNRDYRHEHQSVVVEGIKPISELCEHVQVKTLIAWNETLLPKGVKAKEILLVNENVMKKLSSVQSPEGLVAEIAMPEAANLASLKYIVAFDGINDPGNLGALLRTALAIGWEGAFILEESCDPFNEKALRAARGATFRLPLAWGNWSQLKQLIQNNRLIPYVADLQGQNIDEASVKGGILLVLGNEAHGVSQEAKTICQALTIPMSSKMESLNVSVAGGIIMYALRRKRNGSAKTR